MSGLYKSQGYIDVMVICITQLTKLPPYNTPGDTQVGKSTWAKTTKNSSLSLLAIKWQ